MTEADTQALRYNVRKHGFGDVLKIDANKILIDGHNRLDVLMEEKVETVKCSQFKNAKTAEDRAILRQMFKYNTGKHDHGLEAEEYKRIFDAGRLDELSLSTGRSKDSFAAILEARFGIERPDSIVPETAPAIAKVGDVFQLGSHVLMCGDATVIAEKYFGLTPRVIFTDPPYDFDKFNYLDEFLGNPLFKDLEVLILNSDKPTVKMLRNYEKYFVGFYCITFNSPAPLGNQPMISHRLVSHYRSGKSNFQNLRDAFGTVHEIVLSKSGLTRHEKPLDLPRKFIIHYTLPGEVVLDMFAGSGSTLMACEQTGRICQSIELDPLKVDIIIQRFKDYTHEKVTKV